MEVRLRYFEGCPHWQILHDRLREALRVEGMASVEPILERVETSEDAERLHFIGSPTILVDGRDPFAGGSRGVLWPDLPRLPDARRSGRIADDRAVTHRPTSRLSESRNK